ncbi:MOSC domain-containing protein [Rhizobium sp. L1K21]|uniref:MOSC domain-containing protein n=1 Tax=Rhizobium sp. L1K21 TaxID=2954933 RepID=UPI002093FA1A|nr:MOSC domain-containing protein [Rhizobium sp. L1K21]MCO6186582.1 MOSC domain-containing protein [Rhizobium sp. L1K21]
MKVESLHTYPVKSMRGIRMARSLLTPSGLLGDRRFMITDANGHFITQRECQALAQIQALPQGAYLLLRKGDEEIMVVPPRGERMDVAIWRSIVNASVAPESVNARLSAWLGREVKFVFADAESERYSSPEWAGEGADVGFADGYAVLVTTTASLKALNQYIESQGQAPVGMERFRPNIVVDTHEPWAEDRWAAIEINGVRLDIVKPCERCIMTTQDQMTGERGGPDPLPALRHMRFSTDKRAPGPIFGWNAVPRGQVELNVGDQVTVVEERAEGWPLKQR